MFATSTTQELYCVFKKPWPPCISTSGTTEASSHMSHLYRNPTDNSEPEQT